MGEMLNVLVLLCGLDYTGDGYNNCVKKSKACCASESKILNKTKKNRPFTESEKAVFYKCYSQGAVSKAKSLKR
jgi:hypothetical protein